jgi:hypothetical protein
MSLSLAVRRLDHRSTRCNRIGIAVKADDVGPGLEDGGGVAARPEGAVDNGLAGGRFQALSEPPEKNRNVADRSALGVSFTVAHVRHHSVSPSVADGQEMAVRSFRARDCISSNAAGSQS